jgi:hypothetical protein
MAMDWIERIFHVSPDAGTDALELLFVVTPIAALLIGLLGLFSIRGDEKGAVKSPDRADGVVGVFNVRNACTGN